MTVPAQPVPYDTDIAQAAALIADPTRAVMLRALLSDRPLAAGELGRLAGVSAATASFHLAKLGLRDRVQVVVLAYETGLVRPGTRPAPGPGR